MGGGAGGQSASFAIGILAGYNVNVPSHVAGGVAADSGTGGDFMHSCTNATGSAGRVEYANNHSAATATTTTTSATAAC